MALQKCSLKHFDILGAMGGFKKMAKKAKIFECNKM